MYLIHLRKTLKMNETGICMLTIYLNSDDIQNFLNLHHSALFIVQKYFKHAEIRIPRIISQTSTPII